MFTLNKEQSAKLNAWCEKHKDLPSGAIGGRYTFHFTNTSIGTVIKVTDNCTKEEIDLSDYESW